MEKLSVEEQIEINGGRVWQWYDPLIELLLGDDEETESGGGSTGGGGASGSW